MTEKEITKVLDLVKRRNEVESFLREVRRDVNRAELFISNTFTPRSIKVSPDQWEEIISILETELAVIKEELENV